MPNLYLHTAPNPRLKGTDAVFNETEYLKKEFGGVDISLFPLQHPSSFFPKYFYGWHLLSKLRRLQVSMDLNHLFSPGLYYYPVLNYLSKPIIYSVTASVQRRHILRNTRTLKDLPKIIISNQRDQQLLALAGFKNVVFVRPGMEMSGFRHDDLPIRDELILLMASAPWEIDQFRSKGINLLLESVKKLPFLKLIILLRGTFENELWLRIKRMHVERQVEVINKKVDIRDLLASAHGTILLAEDSNIVKAYPHSLIESLVSGKPVIISSTIAMADYIYQNQCGVVVDSLELSTLVNQIMVFREGYINFALNAAKIDKADFSLDRMLNEVAAVYDAVVTKPLV